jgi:OmpW family
MRRLLVAALLVLCVGRASARQPERRAEARPTFEAGAQHVIVAAADNDSLEIEMSRGFGAHVELFWRDAFSTRAAATFANPAVYTPEVDLGTLGLDIWSATARWHIAPRSRLSGFAGAGGALVVFGDLDDQSGDAVAIEFDPKLAPLVEAGLRYRIHPRIVLELGATYIPLEAESDITVAIDPLIVSAGAAWRF